MIGVEDNFIAYIDNLKGFADAKEDLIPLTNVQLCLVHQMGNVVKYRGEKEVKPMVQNLKKIYTTIY